MLFSSLVYESCQVIVLDCAALALAAVRAFFSSL